MYRRFVLLLITLTAGAVGFCKCANRFIYVEGHITGHEGSRLEIVVQTTPDANWQPQPKVTVQEGTFSDRIYFDSTKSEGLFTHNCSRVPKTVQLLLLENGQQVDSIQLDIDKDFVRDKAGDYKMRSRVEFHLQETQTAIPSPRPTASVPQD